MRVYTSLTCAEKAAGFFVVRSAINGKKVVIVPERGGMEEIAVKDDLVVALDDLLPQDRWELDDHARA